MIRTNGDHSPQNGPDPDRIGAERLGASDEFRPNRSPLAPRAEAAAPLAPRALLNSLRRRWFAALFLGLLAGGGAAAGAWQFVPAPYTAFSELQINSVPQQILPDSAEPQAQYSVRKQTQMKLVTSPFVLNAAIRKPEVARLDLVRRQGHPVHWLEEELRVENAGTEFIRIALKGEHPEELATIVNAVTDAYLAEVVNAEHEKRRVRLAELDKVHRDAEEQLRGKRRAIRSFSESLQASSRQEAVMRRQYLLELALQMRKELAEVHLQLMTAKLELTARQQDEAQPDEPPAVPELAVDAQLEQEPEVQAALARASQLTSYVARYEERVPEDHPRLAEAREKLAQGQQALEEARERLRPTVRERLALVVGGHSPEDPDQEGERQVSFLEARKAKLEEELDGVKIQEEQTGAMSFELDALERQIEQSEDLARTISGEMERLRIELESPVGINLHRPAEVPFERNIKLKLAGTGVGGLGMFILLAGGIVWLDVRARRVSTTDEVVAGLSMRILGTVPIIPKAAARPTGVGRRRRTAFWHGVLTESIDSARTMLLRDAQSTSSRVVMVTSAIAGEGKTTLACHLATSIARAGRTVLLVDCDMRRPSVHRVFDLPAGPGLSEVIRSDVAPDDAILPTGMPGLSVLPAGEMDAAVLRELSQDAAGAVFDQFRGRFDFVIVDSAPVLPVTDSLLVAQHVDAVLFAIRRDVSRLAKTGAAFERLSMLGVPMLGAVVIGLDEGVYGYGYRYAQADQFARAGQYGPQAEPLVTS